MLAKKLNNYNIILASNSPRRQQFLKDLGISFEIKKVNVDEVYPKYLKEEEITDFLADLKSQAYLDLGKNDLLITSDTIVCLGNTVLGKPQNSSEAFKMISSLSDKTHKVITSVCLRTTSKKIVFNDTTVVTFKELSSKEIQYYIEKYKPFDKAGAYGIQEWIGQIGIKKIEGSYFNVVGLPVHKLYKELMNF